MKNIFFMLLALCLTSLAVASEIQGTIVEFSGYTVETHRPYSYVALVTKEDHRLILPRFIKGEKVRNLLQAKMIVDAEVLTMGCTDMSAACPTGSLIDVKSFQISFPKVATDSSFETYSSRLEREPVMGHIFINDGARIAVPEFLDAEALLLENAEVSVLGIARFPMCTNMSVPCEPAKLDPLKFVEVHF
jgi:hypothetical protein